MGRYRSRLEIIADVLRVARVGVKKTRIMYEANLSYSLLTRYLKSVMDMGLMRTEDGDIYELTEKGRMFLDECKGFFERRKELEALFDKVRDERMKLRNKFLNNETSGVNCAGDRRRRKEREEEVR